MGFEDSGPQIEIEMNGVKWSATLAYTFYLTHKQIIFHTKSWLLSMGIPETSWLFLGTILVFSVTASLVLYFAVEKPFLNLRKKYFPGNQ
jgi:peptidoglycan/LPS O-acetylase OafA/YrhL